MALGLNLIGTAMEAHLRENNPIQLQDLRLGDGTVSYQQGLIPKAQYLGVIDALAYVNQ